MKDEGPEKPATEAPALTLEEGLEALQADLDQAVDHDDASGGDLEPQEPMGRWHEDFQDAEYQDEEFRDMAPEGDPKTPDPMQQWREEFKARAKQAELRLQEVGGRVPQAPSAPDPER
jgi:hypothetical protein